MPVFWCVWEVRVISSVERKKDRRYIISVSKGVRMLNKMFDVLVIVTYDVTVGGTWCLWKMFRKWLMYSERTWSYNHISMKLIDDY